MLADDGAGSQILTHDLDIMDTAAVVCVMQVKVCRSVSLLVNEVVCVKGDVEEVFAELDKDNSQTIDASELRDLLTRLGPEEGK